MLARDREGGRFRSAVTIGPRVVEVVPVTGRACALAGTAVVAIEVGLAGVVEGGHKSVEQAGNIVVEEGKSTLRSWGPSTRVDYARGNIVVFQAKRAVEYDNNRIVVGGAGSCIRGRPAGSLPGFLL